MGDLRFYGKIEAQSGWGHGLHKGRFETAKQTIQAIDERRSGSDGASACTRTAQPVENPARRVLKGEMIGRGLRKYKGRT